MERLRENMPKPKCSHKAIEWREYKTKKKPGDGLFQPPKFCAECAHMIPLKEIRPHRMQHKKNRAASQLGKLSAKARREKMTDAERKAYYSEMGKKGAEVTNRKRREQAGT